MDGFTKNGRLLDWPSAEACAAGAKKRKEREAAEAIDREATFLDEYIALCEKHQLFINSCECCNGPRVSKTASALDEYRWLTLEDYRKHLEGR